MGEGNFQISGTTPASASTAVVGSAVSGLDDFESLLVEADLIGATGGTLDVYLQTNPSGDGSTWVDYAHFPQLLAGAAAISYAFAVSLAGQQLTPTHVGKGTSPALAAGSVLGGPWGRQMRCVVTAGASTSAGAAIAINITGQSPRYQR